MNKTKNAENLKNQVKLYNTTKENGDDGIATNKRPFKIGFIKSLNNNGMIEITDNEDGSGETYSYFKKYSGTNYTDPRIGECVAFKLSTNKKTGRQTPINVCKYIADDEPIEVYDLYEWAFCHPGKIESLKNTAAKEKWFFGSEQPKDYEGNNIYPILEKYLKCTFIRLCHENKVMISATDKNYAAFNTGLVDDDYHDIYAIFTRNRKPDSQPWFLDSFIAFVPYSRDKNNKLLANNFRELPERADYFKEDSNIILNTNRDLCEINWEHILKDNINRLPKKLFADFVVLKKGEKDEEYYKRVKQKLEESGLFYNGVKQTIDDEIERELTRAKVNYKTAVPMYYTRKHIISLLLPLRLSDGEHVDAALVYEKTKSGRYLVRTILNMSMAYIDSRLICKPNSEWLAVDNVDSTAIDIEEFYEEGFDDLEEVDSIAVDSEELFEDDFDDLIEVDD